jgi:hypothetical protein
VTSHGRQFRLNGRDPKARVDRENLDAPRNARSQIRRQSDGR